MATVEISDLLFPAFNKGELAKIPAPYGIELFYEFGGNDYWDGVITTIPGTKRALSLHGPCVTVNLADANDHTYLHRYEETFTYGKKVGASFIVIHTNERWNGEKAPYQERVKERLHKIESLAVRIGGPKMVIENVGLKQYNLFNQEEYIALFDEFPQAASLIDVGHAHVNGWDIPSVVKALNSRIFAFHLHDNDGQGDQHLPIFAGNIDWDALTRAIAAYAPNAIRVLEYANGDYAKADELLDNIKTVQERYPDFL